MFNNINPYTLRKEITNGITRFIVSFEDGWGVHRETEVSQSIYLEFLGFIKIERNLKRWDERHLEQSELSDELLYIRALNPQISVEDRININLCTEQLQLALQELSDIQRRRFILYYESRLTFEQIAKKEGCTKRAVKFSIDLARKTVCKKIKKIL